MAALVFGVGYIGSRVVQELLYEDREVVAVDNGFSTDPRAIEAFRSVLEFHFVEGSITDAAVVEQAFQAADEIDVVYLLAAQSSAYPDAAAPDYTEDVNLRGPRIVLDAAVRHGVRRVVFASSTRIYGATLSGELDEASPAGVFSDLSHLSKVYVEKLLEMYAISHGIAGLSVRLGLTYGVSPVMKTDRRFMTAPNLFCLQAARREPLQVRANGAIGLIHVEDAARALLMAGENSLFHSYRALNAAFEISSVAQIAALVEQECERREQPVAVEWQVPLVELPPSQLPSSLRAAGFRPRRSVADGLAETLDHFLVKGQ